MHRRTLLVGALLAALPGIAAAKAQLTAAQEITRQRGLATAQQKSLLVFFHASWCSWCRLFDRFLADPAAAAVMNRHFVVAHLRAQERSDASKLLQLAGADAVYHRYAREGAGLPFFVALDAQERPVVTSISTKTGENIGFPVTRGELDDFQRMLKLAAPAITGGELATLRAACARYAPAHT